MLVSLAAKKPNIQAASYPSNPICEGMRSALRAAVRAISGSPVSRLRRRRASGRDARRSYSWKRHVERRRRLPSVAASNELVGLRLLK